MPKTPHRSGPVPLAIVERTIEYLAPTLEAMIRLQLASGSGAKSTPFNRMLAKRRKSPWRQHQEWLEKTALERAEALEAQPPRGPLVSALLRVKKGAKP